MFGVAVARLLGPAGPADLEVPPGVDIAPHTLPVAEAVGGVVVLDAGAGTAVRVSVDTQVGTVVTVVCAEGGAGRVAVEIGAVRVLIDASGGDPGGVPAPVVDVPAVAVSAGGARVYSLTQRRTG
jgi:hypothetical protein